MATFETELETAMQENASAALALADERGKLDKIVAQLAPALEEAELEAAVEVAAQLASALVERDSELAKVEAQLMDAAANMGMSNTQHSVIVEAASDIATLEQKDDEFGELASAILNTEEAATLHNNTLVAIGAELKAARRENASYVCALEQKEGKLREMEAQLAIVVANKNEAAKQHIFTLAVVQAELKAARGENASGLSALKEMAKVRAELASAAMNLEEVQVQHSNSLAELEARLVAVRNGNTCVASTLAEREIKLAEVEEQLASTATNTEKAVQQHKETMTRLEAACASNVSALEEKDAKLMEAEAQLASAANKDEIVQQHIDTMARLEVVNASNVSALEEKDAKLMKAEAQLASAAANKDEIVQQHKDTMSRLEAELQAAAQLASALDKRDVRLFEGIELTPKRARRFFNTLAFKRFTLRSVHITQRSIIDATDHLTSV